MHIHVQGDESIGQQARSYAEYRLFTVLARAAGIDEVTRASLTLRRSSLQDAIACTLVVELKDGATIRRTARGAHTYAAINCCVERFAARVVPGLRSSIPGDRSPVLDRQSGPSEQGGVQFRAGKRMG